MKTHRIHFANTFCVKLSYSTETIATVKILDEYHSMLLGASETLPIVGDVIVDESLELPSGAVELRKGILYETSEDLYLHSATSIIKLALSPESFRIVLGSKADADIAFFTLEMLVRIYAPLFNLVFLHTGAFIYEGRVITVSAFGGVGKTEVMLYALERGAKFISDDFAILNAKGEVFPYTKKIYLCEYPYTETMLRRLHKSKWLYRLKTFCLHHPGRFKSHVADWLESRYFGVKLDYTDITATETSAQFYPISDFYWAESSDETKTSFISKEDFVKKMSLCLDIESRRYFDYDGYLRLKYPFLETHKEKQRDVLTSIAKNVEVKAVTVRGRDFDDLAQLILLNR